ncbi:hypothetical protein [Nonomuraea zeae]|uniref:hypothetical protein n=1 Tax=Nonomuraea zeae TaxID=1642303 RepID=UPI00360FAD41
MADYTARYIFTWGERGPQKTSAINTWVDALYYFNSMAAWNPVWLNPAGEWKQREDESWSWTAGYDYEPVPPIRKHHDPREVTRYDYWEDIPYWEESERGETVRVLFEGEEYAIEALPRLWWEIWKSGVTDEPLGKVQRGHSGEYWAGPTGWENNVCGNLFDTLYRLKHGKDAE